MVLQCFAHSAGLALYRDAEPRTKGCCNPDFPPPLAAAILTSHHLHHLRCDPARQVARPHGRGKMKVSCLAISIIRVLDRKACQDQSPFPLDDAFKGLAARALIFNSGSLCKIMKTSCWSSRIHRALVYKEGRRGVGKEFGCHSWKPKH